MKFLSICTLFALAANVAAAQSISNEELQERFNKAFSVFNQTPQNSRSALSGIKTQDDSTLKPAPTEASQAENIVKTANKPVVTKDEVKPVQDAPLPSIPLSNQIQTGSFVLLEDRDVLIDMQNVTLRQIVQEALDQVSNNEQWVIRWRLKDENKYILTEKINLTAEVQFDSFIGHMIETITNMTGIRLSTKVFNKNRIIIITDSF